MFASVTHKCNTIAKPQDLIESSLSCAQYFISFNMTTISPSENTMCDMVTGSGNGLLTTSNTLGVGFKTPASTRAREDTDFAYSISRARSPLGTLTFAQHVRSKSASKPKSYLVNWCRYRGTCTNSRGDNN